ncbi:cysteine desulfurase NifS, partial [Candidatus Falkowbacteria bacterium CG10_big_fil_rev_8_21_14_0_10_37_6]
MPKKKKIYLDYAAATPINADVLKVMKIYELEKFGNSGAIHDFGAEAKKALIESRKKIADIIHAGADEIIFTSSATEANNFALKGVFWASNAKKKHLVVSVAEHACVLASAEWLKTQGVDVTVLPVNEFGMVSSADIKKAIKKDTLLV